VAEAWPELDYAAWKDTRDTLHMWTQVAGKVRLKLTPPVNHWWHVPLYVFSRGLTTSPIPHGEKTFELAFDFIDHQFRVLCSDATLRSIPLRPQTTAEFYAAVMDALRSIGVEVRLYTVPAEVSDPIRFEEDTVHTAYDADAAQRFWRALLSTHHVFNAFRGRYLGKVSPVHFLLGQLRPGGDAVLGPRGAGASGRADHARLRHPRGLLPRGVERRLLARRRGRGGGDLLSLRLSPAGGLQRGARAPGDRRTPPRPGRVRPAVRGGAPFGLAGSRPARVPAVDLRGRRGARPQK